MKLKVNRECLSAIAALVVLASGTTSSRAQCMPAYVQFGDDPRTEAWISWRSSDGTPAVLSYGARASYGQTATSIPVAMAHNFVHHVKLEDLMPGTVYHYDDGGVAASFKTAPSSAEPFTWALLSDVQQLDSNPVVPLQKLSGFYADRVKPDFWVNTGDYIQSGDDLARWDAAFLSAGKLYRQAVFMPTLGNTCALGKGLNPKVYFDLFVLPDNGSPDHKEWWYAYEYADAVFLHMLSLRELNERPQLWDAQRRFLDTVLTKTTARWRFVLMHATRDHYTIDSPDDWTPLYERHGVTAVFNGHGHHYTEKVVNGILYMMATKINRTGRKIRFPVIEVGSDKVVVTTWETDVIDETFAGWDNITVLKRHELTASATVLRSIESRGSGRSR